MVEVPRPPPTPERQKEHDRAHAVGMMLGSMEAADKPKRERRAKRSMQHLGPFRDGHKVLREPNGRFAKETAPLHKRPQRIPRKKKPK